MNDKHSVGLEWLCPLDEIVQVVGGEDGPPRRTSGPGALDALDASTRRSLETADLLDEARLIASLRETGKLPDVEGIGESRRHKILVALATAEGRADPGGGIAQVVRPSPLDAVMDALEIVRRDPQYTDVPLRCIGFPVIAGRAWMAVRVDCPEYLANSMATELNKRAPGQRPWHAYIGGADALGIANVWKTGNKKAFLAGDGK